MKRAMISQPMNFKNEQEVIETRNKAIKKLQSLGYEVVNTLFPNEWEDNVIQIPVYFLAKSIEKMTICNAVYFCYGWENSRGCKIEHMCAEEYGLDILEEKITVEFI